MHKMLSLGLSYVLKYKSMDGEEQANAQREYNYLPTSWNPSMIFILFDDDNWKKKIIGIMSWRGNLTGMFSRWIYHLNGVSDVVHS